MDKHTTIAAMLKTEYGREQFRRTVILGLKEIVTSPIDKRKIVAQAILDMSIFGEIPEEWESNPYEWTFQSQADTNMGL